MRTYAFVLISTAGINVISSFFNGVQTGNEWIAPKEANELRNPYKEKKITARVENLFIFNCERCHGGSGKGDGIDGDHLKIKPADLTDQKTQRQTDGAIYWKISNGRGAMDPFKDVLSNKQRWQLVNYIRKLGKSGN